MKRMRCVASAPGNGPVGKPHRASHPRFPAHVHRHGQACPTGPLIGRGQLTNKVTVNAS